MRYVYVGPPSSITLGKKYENREVILGTNEIVDLPEQHSHVARLVARKLLVAPPAKDDSPRPPAKGKARDKAADGSAESTEPKGPNAS